MGLQSRTRSILSLGPLARLALVSIFAMAGAACPAGQPASVGSGAVDTGKAQPPLRTVRLVADGVALEAELAVTPAEQQVGLMHRDPLPDGTGMLFVYRSDQRLSFWMKNTKAPLSIAYLAADGTIKEIMDMQPLSLAPVESTYYVRYALEVPRGWFSRVGLTAGHRFDMATVEAALVGADRM